MAEERLDDDTSRRELVEAALDDLSAAISELLRAREGHPPGGSPDGRLRPAFRSLATLDHPDASRGRSRRASFAAGRGGLLHVAEALTNAARRGRSHVEMVVKLRTILRVEVRDDGSGAPT
jgi:hypothetical protein